VKIWSSTSLWFLCVLYALVADAETQSLDEIRQAISNHLVSILQREARDFDVQVASLDPRLNLPRCTDPLTIRTMREKTPVGDVSVRVRCHGEHPWTIYAKAHVSLFRKVLVTTRPLPKGAMLTADSVALQRMDIASLRQGFVERPDVVLGRYLKRRLPAGYVLTLHLMVMAKVIHKGEAVTIRAHSGALDVRMGGHALMDGEKGQRIRVRNDRSKRLVEAVVYGPGDVRVLF